MKLCTKPFVGAIKPPSNFKQWDVEQQFQPPAITMQPEYVFGYRSKDMRNNIKYLKNGNIIYTAAALGIIYDIKENQQTFFKEHEDDIVSFDVASDGVRVATGEVGAQPQVYLWDAVTKKVINTFQGKLQRGVDLVSFSPNGEKLIATGRDDDHMIVIYDLTGKTQENNGLFIEQKGGRDIMTDIRWRTPEQFVTVGPQHFQLWSQNFNQKENNNFLEFQRGRYGQNECSDQLITVGINGTDILGGAQDGTLQVFKDEVLKTYKPLHSKALQAITCQNELIFTGGNDAKINILDQIYNIMVVIDEKTFQESLCPQIRSIAVSPNNRQIIAGTYGSQIFQLNTQDVKLGNNTVYIPKVIMNGHYTPNQTYTNEVWGLAVFPNNPDLYATASDDATLRIWNSKEKQMIKWTSLNIDDKGNTLPPNEETKDLREESQGYCIAINHDGTIIAVGCRDGCVRIFNASLKQISQFQNATEGITDIQFSPDAKNMAVGSRDNSIYIYSMPNFVKPQILTKHSSYITHLGFSQDGKYMQSTCGAYQLLFWDIKKGKQETRGATKLRDETWQNWNMPIGWPVQGIYQKGMDGTDINAVDRSNRPLSNQAPHNYHLLATGDDNSQVMVFRFPSIQQQSLPVINSGHSSHVTNVKFSADDQQIYSTGGEDQCIIQWSIKKNIPEPGPVQPQTAQVQQNSQFFFH